MNKDLYTLANCIHTSDDFAEEASGRFPDKKYKRSVLAASAVKSSPQPGSVWPQPLPVLPLSLPLPAFSAAKSRPLSNRFITASVRL